MLRVLNCVALCIFPHFIYYYATPLSEYEALTSTSYGALAAVGTALVKGCLTALFVPAGSDNAFLRVSIAAAISGADVAGLWYALTKLPHRNISNSHKFQAVALGWAFVCALLFQLAPILAAFLGSPDFSFSHVLGAVTANIHLAHMLSMACAGVLFWSKRAKPAGLLAVLRLVVVAHAVAPAAISVLADLGRVSSAQSVLLHAGSSGLLAACSWWLWQQGSAKAA
ncbi:hypothetical protein OEZ85_003792 [Tetradesmus obliquus]|uniref:BOS complex subunit TMEM147 n=1 Tax=Tetradesmus obliquus TaxID=3088 RepID=A0ABY8UDL7_TETOB|nr:hypothetical protein OEZ85_003792 [Tetradesmus obliquus]